MGQKQGFLNLLKNFAINFYLMQDFLINHISRTNRSSVLHVVTISHKLKIDQNFWGWVWSKTDVASLVAGL